LTKIIYKACLVAGQACQYEKSPPGRVGSVCRDLSRETLLDFFLMQFRSLKLCMLLRVWWKSFFHPK